VDAEEFDEAEFFRAIDASGARVLLIGRRALIVLGIPVLTADYDLWIAADDAALLNRALATLDMFPHRDADEARAVGRYVIENGERVDVLVARQVSTVDGIPVRFEDVYSRARVIALGNGAPIRVPTTDDLILTKRFALRAKDIADIRLLESHAAREREGS
jgi:hypothetical protein